MRALTLLFFWVSASTLAFDENQVQTAFQKLKGYPHFGRVDRRMGCHVRARVASFLLETQLGITSRLAWIHGCEMVPKAIWNPAGAIRWRAHVAPIVDIVTRGGHPQEWVLDLAFRNAMPLDEWTNRLTRGGKPNVMRVVAHDAMRNPLTGLCLLATTEGYQYLSETGLALVTWPMREIRSDMEQLLSWSQLTL